MRSLSEQYSKVKPIHFVQNQQPQWLMQKRFHSLPEPEVSLNIPSIPRAQAGPVQAPGQTIMTYCFIYNNWAEGLGIWCGNQNVMYILTFTLNLMNQSV